MPKKVTFATKAQKQSSGKRSKAKSLDSDDELEFVGNEPSAEELAFLKATAIDDEGSADEADDDAGDDAGGEAMDFPDLDEDMDDEEDAGGEGELRNLVSHTLIQEWSDKLREPKADKETIKAVIEAFRVAVNQAAGETDVEANGELTDSDLFNAIVRLCFVDLLPAVHKFLHLPEPTTASTDSKPLNPSNSSNWKKIISPMKTYLNCLVKILDVVSEGSVLTKLLRHCLYVVPFVSCYLPVAKRFLLKVSQLWSQGEERVRILAFLCILRLMRYQEQSVLSYILKKLYISYAKNCKLTSHETWPMINFMRQSLVELYSLDQSIAYQQGFVFIRQCAIHVRNAMTGKIKDGYKAVYNWPFVHSLLLWQQMLCSLSPSEVLKPLIYPLVQVIIGTIGLMPIPMNYPLRFHLVKSLIRLSEATNTYIPILPLLVKPLENLHYDTKTKRKPAKERKALDFNCSIRVSHADTRERIFSEAVIKQIYELLLDYLSSQSHSIAFPEMVFATGLKLRKFLKERCKNSDDSRYMKQVLDKIEENVKFIETKRKGVGFAFSDQGEVDSWENARREEGTPITTFFEKWRKLKLDNERKQIERKMEESEKPDGEDEEDTAENAAKGKRKHSGQGSGKVDSTGQPPKKKKKARKGLKKHKKVANLSKVNQVINVGGMEMSSDEE
ncbi:Nucleolar complex protein 2 -like protein [Halotydeus destructor]|nr:Nucleolar complex protein 2 -like protein [Halotydeus destructor]